MPAKTRGEGTAMGTDDLIVRLKRCIDDEPGAYAAELMERAAEEIERLRGDLRFVLRHCRCSCSGCCALAISHDVERLEDH